MSILFEKFREVLVSVLPITLIVVILSFTLVSIEVPIMLRFLLGALFIVVGLTIFLFGVDLGIAPIGNLMGTHITKSNKVWIVIVSGLLLGFFISVAEPDLHILAGQVALVSANVITKTEIIIYVSVGIALLLTVGFLRIIYNKSLSILLTILYGLILIVSLFTNEAFLAISFDASGATTGAMTVPFILALSMGISSLKRGRASEDDSFGLVGIASTGAILAVMLMSVLKGTKEIGGSLDSELSDSTAVFLPFIQKLPTMLYEVALALLPIVIVFVVFQMLAFKLKKKPLKRIIKGLIYTLIGLVLFLTGVNAGFMEVGTLVGYTIANFDNKAILVGIGGLLGLVVILAEPAVYVLTKQIEDVTSGYLKRRVVLVALSLGVSLAVGLSMLRIVIPEIKLWHYLLPGYLLAIVLSYLVPKLFVGMSFDSGGVSSGPMTATFILAFAQGAAASIEGANVLIDGFGLIAMVALMPIIALEILGLIFKIKTVKGGIFEDEHT
ncbi:DUF1538 domain-containing protein [Acetobacterium carbinolicum]|uniref:DUF1538 domain-containing protein n=1 Tax=Acetobacterium TaxID=33951 RepID=UPI000DBEC6EA|nr:MULTISPECIES: DUF1538 domain-containing protein [unclassified Acetobacterium]AWW28594.1 DUF1538 domain-containing protein [Acetobacterium sp. KB-1]MDZ5724018.1 DUF1538 domain-containing protein [Acetobacterium sp. K1/6]